MNLSRAFKMSLRWPSIEVLKKTKNPMPRCYPVKRHFKDVLPVGRNHTLLFAGSTLQQLLKGVKAD